MKCDFNLSRAIRIHSLKCYVTYPIIPDQKNLELKEQLVVLGLVYYVIKLLTVRFKHHVLESDFCGMNVLQIEMRQKY